MTGAPLVTGAAGFAGSHLVERLLQSHDRVSAWCHGSVPASDMGGRIIWTQVDIVDRRAVHAAIDRARPGEIYHCAGLPHVAESWRHADRALQVNALGTEHLLDAVADVVPGTRTVVVGSAMVYTPQSRALTEADPVGPREPYGVSKLAQEMVAERAVSPVVVARPFNHIGPRQSAAFVTSSFARQIAEIEAGRVPPVLKVGNLEARRDMTDVRDTVAGYEALARAGEPGRAYNVCRGTAYRIGDLLDLMQERARVPITIEEDPDRLRPSDNPVVLGDPSLISRDTGWRADRPIERTIDDLLAWWREQVHARER